MDMLVKGEVPIKVVVEMEMVVEVKVVEWR